MALTEIETQNLKITDWKYELWTKAEHTIFVLIAEVERLRAENSSARNIIEDYAESSGAFNGEKAREFLASHPVDNPQGDTE